MSDLIVVADYAGSYWKEELLRGEVLMGDDVRVFGTESRSI
jgi:hypothetical protein